MSTLAVKSHSNLGLLEILTYPLERKGKVQSRYHVKIKKKKKTENITREINGTQNFNS